MPKKNVIFRFAVQIEELGKKAKGKRQKENILVLLPRCLQHFQCKQPVVADINACKSCGKCDIVKLMKLNRHYHLVTAIATGGGLAKRLISDLKPHGVIAVACERELMEGLKGVSQVSYQNKK